MVRAALTRMALAAAMVMTIPVAAVAQVDPPPPEGPEWHLTTYASDGATVVAPWAVDATLLLEDGVASGSSGCNQFSGGYALDGKSLTFDPAITMTRVACSPAQTVVEDGYTTLLPLVASWAVVGDQLELADGDGDLILEFEQTAVDLTASDVAAIAGLFAAQQKEIDRLSQRLDNVRVGTLRDRIKALEAEVKSLRSTQASTPKSGGTTFTAAERTLLQGIPAGIRGTCSPLRGNNPAGTLAAVQCRPAVNHVAQMAYYLMPYASAKRTFNSVMASNGVPPGHECYRGRASKGLLAPSSAEGCFTDGSSRANVRLIEMAAGCRQLNVNGQQLSEPVIYVAIEGKYRKITPLYAWAKGGGSSNVTKAIPAGGQPLSPACRSGG